MNNNGVTRLRSNLWRQLIRFMLLYVLRLLLSVYMGLSTPHFRELSVVLILFVITLLIGRELNLDL
ncbi:hypothetical protein B1218_35555, partial [Pseudomonas ogarae]